MIGAHRMEPWLAGGMVEVGSRTYRPIEDHCDRQLAVGALNTPSVPRQSILVRRPGRASAGSGGGVQAHRPGHPLELDEPDLPV